MTIPAVLLLVLVALVLLILYYTLLIRANVEMLQSEANPVLLAFALSFLLPLPPTLILGVFVMIIWRSHKSAGQIPQRS